jgi:hypothetical protein
VCSSNWSIVGNNCSTYVQAPAQTEEETTISAASGPNEVGTRCLRVGLLLPSSMN